MDVDQENLAIAIAAQAALQTLHERFVAHIASMASKVVNGGSFTTDGQSIAATALGINFRVMRRPISIAGKFALSEYAFVTEHENKDLCLWHLYLDPHGALHTDSALSNRLCEFNNTYLPSKVVSALASSLLASPIFALRP